MTITPSLKATTEIVRKLLQFIDAPEFECIADPVDQTSLLCNIRKHLMHIFVYCIQEVLYRVTGVCGGHYRERVLWIDRESSRRAQYNTRVQRIQNFG